MLDFPAVCNPAHEGAGGGGPGHPAEPVESGPPLRPLAVCGGAGQQDFVEEAVNKTAHSLGRQIEQEGGVAEDQQEDQENNITIYIDVGDMLHGLLDAGDGGKHHRDAGDDGHNEPKTGLAGDSQNIGDAAGDVQEALGHGTGHAGTDGEEGDGINNFHGERAGGILAQHRCHLAGDGEGALGIVVHEAEHHRGHGINGVGDDGPVEEHGLHGELHGFIGHGFDAGELSGGRHVVSNGFRRPPEQHSGCHSGGQCNGEPGKVGQLRLGIFAADAYIAEFSEHSSHAYHDNGQRQNAGRPAQVGDDPVVNVVDQGQKCFLINDTQRYEQRQNDKRRQEGSQPQLVFLVLHTQSLLSFFFQCLQKFTVVLWMPIRQNRIELPFFGDAGQVDLSIQNGLLLHAAGMETFTNG